MLDRKPDQKPDGRQDGADPRVGQQSTATAARGSHRSVTVRRTSTGRYTATNPRGGTIRIGTGDGDDFTPVELLLAGIAACSAVDVDSITSRRSEPDRFTAVASGDKISDQLGNRLVDLLLDFDVSFPDDEGGRKATGVLGRTIRQSHDRLCSVGRTVEVGTPITASLQGEPLTD